MTSFECLPDSYQLAPLERAGRMICGCCGGSREITAAHPRLGPLCSWCSLAFDYRLDANGVRVREEQVCGACLELGEPCALHGGAAGA